MSGNTPFQLKVQNRIICMGVVLPASCLVNHSDGVWSASWPMLGLTIFLIVGISVGGYVFLFPELHWAFSIMGVVSLLAVLFALQRTACVNPGIIPRSTRKPEDGNSRWRWHEVAQTFLPPSAHVCEDACVAAEEIDHFCPWTGTLIAKNNLVRYVMQSSRQVGVMFAVW